MGGKGTDLVGDIGLEGVPDADPESPLFLDNLNEITKGKVHPFPFLGGDEPRGRGYLHTTCPRFPSISRISSSIHSEFFFRWGR
jgi:hypothetical protein